MKYIWKTLFHSVVLINKGSEHFFHHWPKARSEMTDKRQRWHRWIVSLRTVSCGRRRKETQRRTALRCHLISILFLTESYADIDTRSASTMSSRKLDYLTALWMRRHRTASLCAHVASLLGIHTYSSLPRKRPLLWAPSGTRVSPTEWITRLGTETRSLAFSSSLKPADGTCTVGPTAGRQSCLPRSGRWVEPRVAYRICGGTRSQLSEHYFQIFQTALYEITAND